MQVNHNPYKFYVEVSDQEYRTVGTTFKPKEMVSDEEWDNNATLMLWLHDILSTMIFEVLKYESTTGKIDSLEVEVDEEEIPYTIKSVEKFLTAIESWAKENPIIETGVEPHIHNKGCADYNDPEWRYGIGILPDHIKNLLKKNS